jgi:hypothetical protein
VADRAPQWAILAATSGGFQALGDVAFPTGVELYAAVDNDPSGDVYAEQIRKVLEPRPVRRMQFDALPAPASKLIRDLSDALDAGFDIEDLRKAAILMTDPAPSRKESGTPSIRYSSASRSTS